MKGSSFVFLILLECTGLKAADVEVYTLNPADPRNTTCNVYSPWFVRNNTNSVVTAVLERTVVIVGAIRVDPIPYTLQARQVAFLACAHWMGSPGNPGGDVSFRVLSPIPAPVPAPPPTQPPSSPPPQPEKPPPGPDPTFKYIGMYSGTAEAGENAFHTSAIVPLAPDLGMVLDKSYQQSSIKRGCCGGGAVSPLTAADIPRGVYVETGGGSYWAVFRPSPFVPIPVLQLNKDGFPVQIEYPSLQIPLYCGPPAHANCVVFIRVWIKQKPRK
jgi:hypothetical protein